MRSIASSLIKYESIVKTEAKAKELRPYIEELVTKARKNDLATKRALSSKLGNDFDIAKKLIEEIAPKYSERPGGYTRIIKLPVRIKDAAKMAQISFVK
jgi:large subunit ribosomal protein L17